MLGRTRAVALVGLTGHVVEVESHLAPSLPAFTLVGLPDASLAEARDRVRAAVTSSGLAWPNRRITVNLSPATLPKAGSSFDLAIAAATLAGAAVTDPASVAAWVHLGELGLDGRLRPVRGVLPAVAAAVAAGHRRVLVPVGNVAEAGLVPGVEVRGAGSLAEVAAHHGADVEVPDVEPVLDVVAEPSRAPVPDLEDVLGQDEARFGLEVAAAGGHHLLMVGPPGAGKTMLAARLPGVLPDLDESAAVEVTAVHSVAGTFEPRRPGPAAAVRGPAPHRDAREHHRGRVGGAAARCGVARAPRSALPRRGAGVHVGRAADAASAARAR